MKKRLNLGEGLSKSYGLTLIELMIGLAIVSIVILFAIPQWEVIDSKNQMDKIEYEISAAIHYARNKALISNTPLILRAFTVTNEWSMGMELVTKATHQLLYQWQWSHQGLKINWKGFNSDHYLQFAPNIESMVTSGHFDIKYGRYRRQLTVNRLGRVSKYT